MWKAESIHEPECSAASSRRAGAASRCSPIDAVPSSGSDAQRAEQRAQKRLAEARVRLPRVLAVEEDGHHRRLARPAPSRCAAACRARDSRSPTPRVRVAVRVGEADLVGELAIAEHQVDAGVAPHAIEIAAAVRLARHAPASATGCPRRWRASRRRRARRRRPPRARPSPRAATCRAGARRRRARAPRRRGRSAHRRRPGRRTAAAASPSAAPAARARCRRAAARSGGRTATPTARPARARPARDRAAARARTPRRWRSTTSARSCARKAAPLALERLELAIAGARGEADPAEVEQHRQIAHVGVGERAARARAALSSSA